MTQAQLIREYCEIHGSILPAKISGVVFMGLMFGSETSKRCRELRKKGILRSEKDGRFERYYLNVVQSTNQTSGQAIQQGHSDQGPDALPVQLPVLQGYAWKSDQPFPETKKRVSAVRPRKRGLGLF